MQPQIISPQKSNQHSNRYLPASIETFAMIWRYKFLWLWGLLLPSGLSINYKTEKQNFDKINFEMISFYAQQYWMQFSIWIIIGIIIVLILIIAFWSIFAIARGGVINSLNKLQEIKDNENIDRKKFFKEVWLIGRLRFWNIIKLDLMFFLVGVFLIIIAIPPIYFAVTSKISDIAFAIIALALIVFVPIAIIIFFFVKNISLRYVAVINETFRRSVDQSCVFLMKNKKEALKLILTIFLFALFFDSVFGIIFAIIKIIFIALSLLIPNFFTPTVETTFLVAIFIILILLAKSIFSLWQQNFWLWWIKKIGGLKIEQPQEQKATIKSDIENIIQEEKVSEVITEKINS